VAGVLETAFARVSLSARLVNAIPHPPGLLANCRLHPRANCRVQPRARRASRQGARTRVSGQKPRRVQVSHCLHAPRARCAFLLPRPRRCELSTDHPFFFLINRHEFIKLIFVVKNVMGRYKLSFQINHQEWLLSTSLFFLLLQ
jgi:hypothetical protein